MYYISYTDYVSYGGTSVTEAEFPKYEFLAESILDWYTFNRLQDDTEISERVKRVLVILVDVAKKKEDSLSLGLAAGSNSDTATGYVKSQSNDGVSISYNGMTATDLYSLIKNEAAGILDRNLQGVMNNAGRKLLYRGLYPGE